MPTTPAEHTEAAISGAQLRWLPDGPHVAFLVDPDAQRKALAWLRQHAPT